MSRLPLGTRYGREQSVVDDNVTVDARDAGGADLLGEVVDAEQWILRGEDRGAESVGVVVVEVGVLHGIRVDPATTEHEVAAADEDQVAVESALLVDRAGAVDRGGDGVVGAECVEGEADREQLAGGSGERHRVRFEGVELLAGRHVADQQSPGSVGVTRLLHDLGDAVG